MNSRQNLSVLRGPAVKLPENVRLQHLFENKCQNIDNAERTAIIYEDAVKKQKIQISYGTLEKKANQIAKCLEGYGTKIPNSDGDFVILVCMEPSDKLIITLLAIWKFGAAYLPLDINSPANRIEHIISEVSPCLIITEGDKMNMFEKVSIPVMEYKNLETESSVFPETPLQLSETISAHNPDPIAIILYTSGSTGIPKGVRLPHLVIMNRLNWQWKTFPFEKSEIVCAFKTAMTFVDAVSEIWSPLLHTDSKILLVIPREITKDPERLINLLDRYKVERLVLVPTLLQSMLLYLNSLNKRVYMNETYLLLNTLRLWVCSGETLSINLVKQFLRYFNNEKYVLCNFYGSTEIMGDVSYYIINSHQSLCFGDKIPIGVPIDNTSLYVLDKNLKPVNVGEIGELYVAGSNLAAGYVAGRDSTKFILNSFSMEPEKLRLYQTGDYAKIENNNLLYEGRTDSQIKVRGHRVDLTEVQSALNNFGLHIIQKSAVFCYMPGDINQAVLAFVKLNDGINLTGVTIENELKKYMASYAIPQVLIIDDIPLLNNGKVNRQLLLRTYENNKENYSKGSELMIDYDGIDISKMAAAKCLFETIAEVLGNKIRHHISRESNFYELGGDSLNCIYTITKLKEKGYFIGITDFIMAPNLDIILEQMYAIEEDMKENIPLQQETKKKNLKNNKYFVEMLSDKYKEQVSKIIADSFHEKADLEQWLEPKPIWQTYIDLMEVMWKPLIEKNLSFVVISEETLKCVGVSLNFDAHDEPEVIVNNNLVLVFEFLEFLEAPIRKNVLPIGKWQVLHSFMMGTAKELNSAQNVTVITYMEEENLKLARKKGFAGIFTTNTNPLTQQLGTDVFNYQILEDYQVNRYVASDGTKPFKDAPDQQRAVCSWKQL